jgi:hypothetical protein
VLEDTFPDCLQERAGKVLRVCVTCGEELDCQHGHWVPKVPGAEIRGYHLCQLFSEFADLKEILKQYEKSGRDETFWRQKLGKPFVNAENRLSRGDLMACRRAYHVNLDDGDKFMGCDTGKGQHYFVLQRDGEQYRTIAMGHCDDFNDLSQIMHRYNVSKAVIDPGGNIVSVREFVRRHEGRAYSCYYHGTDKKYLDWDENEYQVNAHRTATLDASTEAIRRQELILPMEENCAELGEFMKHCQNLVKTKEEDADTGRIRFTWIRSGPDHYRHAWNYAFIAAQNDIMPAVRFL